MRKFLKCLPSFILCLPLYAASQTFISQGPAPTNAPIIGPHHTDSGSTQPIAVSPIDSNTIFVGGNNGGIWRTTDFGNSWTPLTDHLASLSIQSLDFDLTDASAKTLIAGVGVSSNGGLTQEPATDNKYGGPKIGIYYSTDGGNSWTAPAGNSVLAGQSISSTLAQGPFLLAGTFEPTAFRVNIAGLSVGSLYRSLDTGSNFAAIPVSGAPLGTEPVTAIVTPPNDPNTIYVAISRGGANNLDTALYKTTNQGASFSPIFTSTDSGGLINSGAQTILRVATGPSGSIAVGIVDSNAGPPGEGGQLVGIFLSQDHGMTWTELNLADVFAAGGFNPGGNGLINSAIAMDPVNPNIVFAAGTEWFKNPNLSGGSLWQLELSNANTIATNLSEAADGSLTHVDLRSLVFARPGQLLVSGDGGLDVRSTPGPGGTWTSLNGNTIFSNLSLGQIYISAYDANNNLILVGTQDEGCDLQNIPFQPIYTLLIGGDGQNTAINDQTSDTISYHYFSSQDLGGLTRAVVSNGMITVKETLNLTGDPITEWFGSKVVLNRLDPTKLVFGGEGDVLTAVDPLVGTNLTLTSVGPLISASEEAYAMSYGTQSHPMALLVGTLDSTLYFTDDTTTTDLANLPAYTGNIPNSVVFDTRTKDRFYIADGQKVWETTDTGVTFTNLTPNFPATFFQPWSVEFLSNNGVNALFAGGLSSNGTLSPFVVADSDGLGVLSNYRLFGLGLPNTMINYITYNPKSDTLLSSAFGRGAWLMYDVTSNFPQATVLQFGLANNDSTPDTSILSGNRPLNKYGSGTLLISGAATYTGLSTIFAGKMAVNGSIPGDVIVNNTGTLSGNGTVGGIVLVQSGGTLSPGNPIGTLTLSSLILEPGSLVNIQITPQTASLVNVIGNAALSGNVVVNQDLGNYPATGAYSILTAGSITGSFNSEVLGGLPGFAFSLSQQSNLVQLLYRRFILLNGISGNARIFGKYINQFGPTSEASELLSVLTGKTLKKALIAASPLRNGIPIFIIDNTSFFFSTMLGTHFSEMHYSHLFEAANEPEMIARSAKNLNLDELFASNTFQKMPCEPAQQKCQEKEKNTLWLDAFGAFSRQDQQHQTPEFNFTTSGLILGYDRWVNKKTTIGAAAGFAHNHFHESDHLGHGAINTGFLAPYATAYVGDAFIETALLASYNHIDNRRHISFPGFKATASSRFHTWQLMPHLGIGYDVAIKCFILEPFALFDWVVNWQDDFREHGGKPFNAKQKNHTSSMLRSELGLRFYQNWKGKWGTFVLREVAAYVNKAPFNVGRVTAALVGFPSSFTVVSFKDNQNLATWGISGLLKGEKGYFGMLSYDGEAGSGYLSQVIQIKFGKFF